MKLQLPHKRREAHREQSEGFHLDMEVTLMLLYNGWTHVVASFFDLIPLSRQNI